MIKSLAVFAKNPCESFVDLCDRLNNAVVWKKKKVSFPEKIDVEQQVSQNTEFLKQ